jgi:hypothetical protein
MKPSRWQLAFGFSIVLGAAVACGSSGGGSGFGDGSGKDAGSGGDDGGSITLGGDGGIGGLRGTFNASTFAITPPTSALTITQGVDAGAAGTVQLYTTDGGQAFTGALFSIDRAELGTIGATSGLFTANGSLGGTVTVTATYMGATATATIAISLQQTQNGASDALTSATLPDGGTATSSVTAFGPGGYGGVGGDGSGAAVSPAQQAALDAAATDGGGATDGAGWLYPYDGTMFPRGILAPLLQWSVGSSGDYAAVKVQLHEAGFDYTGYFAKPFLAKTFGDIPIPADVWTSVYSSYTSATSKDDLSVTVTLLPKSGTGAFALPTRTWHIAGGSLRGKIYYQSYGTKLAANDDEDYNGNPYGGATLAISPGASAPTVAAGASACQVCHSVAANGSSLITQEGSGYGNASQYVLTGTTSTENMIGASHPFPAVSPDGTTLFSNSAPVPNASTPSASGFATVATGGLTALPMAGLPANLLAWFPTFSPDGTKVAYDDGTANALMLASVDLAGHTFGTPSNLFTPTAIGAFWPTFMPASDGVVFEQELVSNNRGAGEVGTTRSQCDTKNGGACLEQGAHGELWYVNVATGKSVRLAMANGDGYLPPHLTAYNSGGVNDTTKDAEFNYEPTVNPVVSGGYAWVVFTSRRLYGNVATINPFESDPRFTDISQTPTTKKLWVAAIDLSADGTTDPSFAAFYLPGQELLAGNSRGFWVVDPCQADGSSCSTGDECCGGYCQATGDGGAFVCSDVKPTCAAEYDKCATAADCCDTTLECIGGRCSVSSPR